MATMRVAAKPELAPMKVAQISRPGGDFEIVEREIPRPGAGHVRIRVQACGVCHSDMLTKEGLWPGIEYPRVPGHEGAGTIDELGAGVSAWNGRLWATSNSERGASFHFTLPGEVESGHTSAQSDAPLSA